MLGLGLDVTTLTRVLQVRMHYLSLHVHDDDRVGTVTDNKLFHVARQCVDAMNCDVGSCHTAQ